MIYIPAASVHVLFSSSICLVLPLLLLFLVPANVESHHTPSQILHAVLARELVLGPREEFPDLSRKRIILLHSVDTAIGVGQAILEKREKGAAAQALPGKGICGGHIGLVLLEAGRSVTRVWDAVRVAAALSGSVVNSSARPCTWPSWKTKVVLCYYWVHC